MHSCDRLYARPATCRVVPQNRPIGKTRSSQRVGAHGNNSDDSRDLKEFGVEGTIVGHQEGPSVTIYEFQPAAGTKQAKVHSLIDDLALALKVDSLFIKAVPGKRALGIEVPNQCRKTVLFGDLCSKTGFGEGSDQLSYIVGTDGQGQVVQEDLTQMPHLLIAGATGSGKSVGINTLISSLLVRYSPAKVQFIMIDPKLLELSIYEGVPHLMTPVITTVKETLVALQKTVDEMERRFAVMQGYNVKNIAAFNKVESEGLKKHEAFPYIVIIIDELADLMLSAPKEIETLIQKLAQKARASGIHLILATQRPSVDILTGKIKANLPSRISFQVPSRHDSRTILDQDGAEKLLGRGDLLLQKPGTQMKRIQGEYISDIEIEDLVEKLKKTTFSNIPRSEVFVS